MQGYRGSQTATTGCWCRCRSPGCRECVGPVQFPGGGLLLLRMTCLICFQFEVSTRGSSHPWELHVFGLGGVVDDLQDSVVRDCDGDGSCCLHDSFQLPVFGGTVGQLFLLFLDHGESLIGWSGGGCCGCVRLLLLGDRFV